MNHRGQEGGGLRAESAWQLKCLRGLRQLVQASSRELESTLGGRETWEAEARLGFGVLV